MKSIAIIVALLAVIAVARFALKSATSTNIEASLPNFPPEVSDRIDQARAEREAVRGQDPEFFEAVSKAMFERDPIGINFKTNTDEYEAEAGTVIPRLSTCTSVDDVATVLHEEFVKWFDASTAGSLDRYLGLAEDIWTLHNKRGPNKRFEPTSGT